MITYGMEKGSTGGTGVATAAAANPALPETEMIRLLGPVP